MSERVCPSCGARFPRAKAQCPECKSWCHASPVAVDGGSPDGTVLLSDAALSKVIGQNTGPWDSCFSSRGIVNKSVVLIGGEPGAGKSTVGLQLASILAKLSSKEALYAASEESVTFIRDRAERLRLPNLNRIRVVPLLDGFEGDFASVIEGRAPCVLINDSLSGMTKDPAEQVEYCKKLKSIAVRLDIPILVIDHVNKADDFAGFRELQHVVDTTVTLFTHEGAPNARIMRSIKNRFGAPSAACLTMTEFEGLIACSGCAVCDTDSEEDYQKS